MTSLEQLAQQIKTESHDWKELHEESGELDSDLLEGCADALTAFSSALVYLSSHISSALDSTMDEVLQDLPDEAVDFIHRFREGFEEGEVEEKSSVSLFAVAFDGFPEIRILMQEQERWEMDDDVLLEHSQMVFGLLENEEPDEDWLEVWLDDWCQSFPMTG